MNLNRSEELFKDAQRVLPGGVNSPVRAYGSIGMIPPFISRASGARVYDEDGNEYIDYVGSWGPMILGHSHGGVLEEIRNAIDGGTSFGAPTRREVEIAELIVDAVPSIEMVRMVNSGTEAVMSAIRLARGYTGRDLILKFDGCYHGHSDGLLVKAGSGALTTGVPNSAGVPGDYAKNTMTAGFNSVDQVKRIFNEKGNELAAVILEPVAGNMGVVLPDIEFLKTLERLTVKYGVLLIFDEVITGFRVSYGGAQEYYGINPDITVLGKILGGGMPVGAYGGKKEIMEMISPNGPVYQAGTLSGNPLAMAGGIAVLKILRDNPLIYSKLEDMGAKLEAGLKDAADKVGVCAKISRIGSLLGISMDCPFKGYFIDMLFQGIYLAPSQYEAMFISSAHTDEDIGHTIEAARNAFAKARGEG